MPHSQVLEAAQHAIPIIHSLENELIQHLRKYAPFADLFFDPPAKYNPDKSSISNSILWEKQMRENPADIYFELSMNSKRLNV
jgi:16S rRNA G966 N2-methylase RsmD